MGVRERGGKRTHRDRQGILNWRYWCATGLLLFYHESNLEGSLLCDVQNLQPNNGSNMLKHNAFPGIATQPQRACMMRSSRMWWTSRTLCSRATSGEGDRDVNMERVLV